MLNGGGDRRLLLFTLGERENVGNLKMTVYFSYFLKYTPTL